MELLPIKMISPASTTCLQHSGLPWLRIQPFLPSPAPNPCYRCKNSVPTSHVISLPDFKHKRAGPCTFQSFLLPD